MTSFVPHTAMVLAAGLGERMRPLTHRIPKPLVEVSGKPLIDYGLDKLKAVGVTTAIVNVHYLADSLEQHLASRTQPRIVISDERTQLLGTGGGVVKALPLLGSAPFFHVNSDSIWLDAAEPNFQRLARAFDRQRMDALLLLVPVAESTGYTGSGDFFMGASGLLRRRQAPEPAPFIYAGAALLTPKLFADMPDGPFSLTRAFDKAQSASRLFGLPLQGLWMHVGTPDAIALAEAAIAANAA